MTQKQAETARFSKEWWASLEGIMAAIGVLIALAGLFITIILAMPDPPEPPSELVRTPALGLSFWQNGKMAYMADAANREKQTDDYTPRTTVKLQSAPFEMRFPESDEDNGLRINAWKSPVIFNVIEGTDTTDITTGSLASPFHRGRALADTSKTSAILHFNIDAYSYVGGERAYDVGNKTRAVYYARIDDPRQVKYTSFPEHAYSPTNDSLRNLADWKDNIYLTIWQDTLQDGVIASDEYEYIILTFQDK